MAGICSSNYSHCGSREDGDKCRQAPAKPPNDSANKQIGIMNTQKAARCVIVSWLRPCVGIRSDSFDEHFPCRGCCKFKRLKRPERLNVPHNCVKMQQNVAASQREASIFFFMVVKPPHRAAPRISQTFLFSSRHLSLVQTVQRCSVTLCQIVSPCKR